MRYVMTPTQALRASLDLFIQALWQGFRGGVVVVDIELGDQE